MKNVLNIKHIKEDSVQNEVCTDDQNLPDPAILSSMFSVCFDTSRRNTKDFARVCV
jgi:hypothetical protein